MTSPCQDQMRLPPKGNRQDEKYHQKGHENVHFWVLHGLAEISAGSLE
jgi:ribonuclease I